MGTEPISLSMGCLEDSGINGDCSTSFIFSPLATNSLNRRKIKPKSTSFRRSWGPVDKDAGKQEFWASIQEPYDFIMGTHLLPESYEISDKERQTLSSGELELYWDPSDVSLSYEWSYSEFLDQYNELYEWLIQVQLKLYSHSNPPDKISRMAQQEELNRRSYRRKLFVEQGGSVAQRYPSSAEEISWRVNYLNNKWEQLLTTLTPVKGQTHLEVELDLAHEEDILCNWLCTIEGQIQPLTCRLPRGSSVQTLQERHKDNQILLKDIEAHGPILKSVLRQYERLARNDANSNCKSANAKIIDSSSPSDEPPSDSSTPNPSQFSAIDPFSPAIGKNSQSLGCSSPLSKGATRIKVPRRARSLEKRWHQIYLRSLEWHYYLEGAIANFQNLNQSCSSESDDEPVTKCRRLSQSSYSSASSGASNHSRRRRRSRSWSERDLTPSEAGSYIEDDYVSLSGIPSAKDQRKRAKREVASLTSMDVTDQVEVDIVEGNRISRLVSEMKENSANGNVDASVDSDELWLLERPDRSSLTEVERPSINCGVFEYKHRDTDSEDQTKETTTEVDSQNRSNSFLKKKEVTEMCVVKTAKTSIRSKLYLMQDDDAVHQDELQEIIDSAILDQDWLNSNLTSDSESMDSVPILGRPVQQQPVDQNSNFDDHDHLVPLIKKEPLSHCCSKESISRLISDVEHLVHNGSRGEPLSRSPRQCLKPLSFGLKAVNKQHRITQWLSSQSDTASLLDSCDASGELTTGESDSESNSSSPNLDSCTVGRGSGDLLASSENTPTAESFPPITGDLISKVVRRGKKRTQNEQRPWSISELHQLTLVGNSKGQTNISLLSSSETALNNLSNCNFKNIAPSLHSSDTLQDPNVTTSTSEKDILKTPTSSLISISPSKSSSTFDSPQTVMSKYSTSLTSTDSLKKRRSKFRRRSLNYLGRRTDSGSDEKNNGPQHSDLKPKSAIYSPYHLSLTNPLSSDSEGVSQSPLLFKNSSLLGQSVGGGVTSSTEQYLSDSSLVSGVPKPSLSASESISKRIKPEISPHPSQLLSPRGITSDNDATNTQEDVSSLSEQAWDPYQEYKYLSEPYSEDVDQDAVRRLLDFGDDYSKYIGSEGASLRFPNRRRRSPHHKKIRTYKSRPSADSDSDIDDLHHVIQESKSQLDAMESVLEKHSPEATLGLDFGELLTTIKTNLKCLQEILKHLEMDAPDLQTELNDVRSIIQRWSTLESKATDRQRQSTQLRQLQRQVKSVKLSMESISDRCSALAHPHSMALPSQLKQKVEEANNLLIETEKLKVDLSSLNVVIHRFTVDVGPSLSSLKDEVAELYRMYDEILMRVSAEVARLESAEAIWRLWEEQKLLLMEDLKQDKETLKILDTAIDTGRMSESLTASVQGVAKLLNEKKRNTVPDDRGYLDSYIPSSNTPVPLTNVLDSNKYNDQRNGAGVMEESKDDHLSDSGTSGYESCSSDDLSERERRLAYLRHLARDLEANLIPGSKAWNDICFTLTQAENELRGLQTQCQNLILKTAETLEKGPLKSGLPQNSCKRRSWTRETKRGLRPDKKRTGRGNRGWIWRVARAALPFQLALLLLFCVACLLEPNCCDSVNTLNLSFGPQLRYVHGAPPV